jgi:hypothetical protein
LRAAFAGKRATGAGLASVRQVGGDLPYVQRRIEGTSRARSKSLRGALEWRQQP